MKHRLMPEDRIQRMRDDLADGWIPSSRTARIMLLDLLDHIAAGEAIREEDRRQAPWAQVVQVGLASLTVADWRRWRRERDQQAADLYCLTAALENARADLRRVRFAHEADKYLLRSNIEGRMEEMRKRNDVELQMIALKGTVQTVKDNIFTLLSLEKKVTLDDMPTPPLS